MTKLRYLTKEGFRSLRVNRLMTAASVTVLFSCLLLVGIAFMLLVNIETFIGNIERENVVMVYAKTDISAYDYIRMRAQLESVDYVGEVEAVEKGPAYEKVLSELDENVREYLQSLDENPLPDAYKVTVSDMDHFNEVVDSVKKLENVLRVHENSSLARQLSAVRNAVQYISLGIIQHLLKFLGAVAYLDDGFARTGKIEKFRLRLLEHLQGLHRRAGIEIINAICFH